MFADRVLLLIPHPDDEVVGCCAAIGRARSLGCEMHGFYLTTGVPARETLWPWERGRHAARVACRWREAEQAAALLQLREAGRTALPSRSVKDHLAMLCARVEEVIRTLSPGALWAPAYEGGHQDHDAASFLASLFGDRMPVWEFSEYNYAGGRCRSQEFPDGGGEILTLTPEERDCKGRLLGIYRSEQGNLAHVRTEQEAFRPLPRHDYSRRPHSGTLFYERFHWVPRHPRVDYVTPEQVSRALAEFSRRR